LVRKSELTDATWDEIDFTNGIWTIPAERMKRRNLHNVHLFRRAIDKFIALRTCAAGSMHEAGYNTYWIEKCLAHEQRGVRAVYNRAEYAQQRRAMPQDWADTIDRWVNGA
jgi:integrase